MKFFEQPSKTLFEIAAYIYSQLQAHLILVTNYTNNDNVSVFLVSISCRNCCSSENFCYIVQIFDCLIKKTPIIFIGRIFFGGGCVFFFFYQAIKYLKLKKKIQHKRNKRKASKTNNQKTNK